MGGQHAPAEAEPPLDVDVVHREGLRIDRGRGFRRVNENHVDVYDLDMASWFHLQNLPIVQVSTNGREFVITFLDREAETKIPELSMDWLNSEACKFSAALRQLKKVCISHKKGGRGGRDHRRR